MLSSDGNFHIGDKVVYPNHGVGIIEQISSRTIGETVERFYLLKIKSSSLKVMVPFHNVGTSACGESSRTAKSRRLLIFFRMASATTTPTGNTASKRTPTGCAPARCWKSRRC